ncbi:MAG TPA: hypothetical protein VHQ90_05425 [Thermoanaerobaculia bacterium]|nr:hypothetical protein [Thermoanaerobaculia bacterium]
MKSRLLSAFVAALLFVASGFGPHPCHPRDRISATSRPAAMPACHQAAAGEAPGQGVPALSAAGRDCCGSVCEHACLSSGDRQESMLLCPLRMASAASPEAAQVVPPLLVSSIEHVPLS